MSEQLPVAVWSGEIMGVRVHVLDNGMRIVDAEDMWSLLERMGEPGFDLVGFATSFSRWQNGGEP